RPSRDAPGESVCPESVCMVRRARSGGGAVRASAPAAAPAVGGPLRRGPRDRAQEGPCSVRGVRGVVWDGTQLVVAELDVRDPGPGEVQVRVLASGICHSDLNVM